MTPGELRKYNAAKAARWYARNSDKAKDKSARWRAANPEKERAARLKYWDKNRTKINHYAKLRARARRAADPEGEREKLRQWYRDNPVKRKAQWVRRAYKMSLDELNRLIKHHKKRCGLCGCKPKALCVDHNHATGEIRGMLCAGCNHMLHRSKDNVAFFRLVIAYLTKPPARTIKIQGKGRINPKY